MPSPEATQNIKTPKPPKSQSLQQATDAPPNVEALSTLSTTAVGQPNGASLSTYTGPRRSMDGHTPPATIAPTNSPTCNDTGADLIDINSVTAANIGYSYTNTFAKFVSQDIEAT